MLKSLLLIIATLWIFRTFSLPKFFLEEINTSYHVKIYIIVLETLRRSDVINIGLKVGPSEPRGFCDWYHVHVSTKFEANP